MTSAKAIHIGVEVIMDGQLMSENLSRLGRNEKWLEKQIKIQGFKDASDIFLGIYHAGEDKLTLYPNQ